MRWLSRLITIAVVLVVVAGAALLINARVPRAEINGTFPTFAKFRDGSKLVVGSPVVIAGVRIGDITRLTIEGRFARVDLTLRDDIQVPYDSFVTRRADSLFGDSYLEIIPTLAGEGTRAARMLAPNEQLIHVIEGSSTDSVLRAMDRSMPKIESTLDILHETMLDGRKVVNGRVIENMSEADSWLAAGKIEGPIQKASQALARIDDLTTRGASAMGTTTPRILDSLRRLDQGVADARTSIRDARSGLVTAMADTRAGLDNLDEPIEQARQYVAAIDEGEGDDWRGTLGRLVNDPKLAEDLEDATSAGRDATSSLYRFKSWLGMRVEFNVFSRIPRVYATAELRARTDKFYLVEFEKGSLGGVPTDRITDAAGTSAFIRHQEIRDTLRFTAQFGKQIGPLAIRGGVKDSTFGFGVDVLLMDGRLKLSNDIFGGFDPMPRIKVAAAFAVFRSIYVIAGIDDALNAPGYLQINNGINQEVPTQFTEVRYGRDYFIGGTLHFDDADLSTLLRVYGALLAGALAL